MGYVTDSLLELISANKELPFAPSWTTEAGREFSQLVSPVDVDGLTIQGARFGAKAHIYRHDQCVSFRLDTIIPEMSGKYTPLIRFDWLPGAAHNNAGRGPEHLKFQQFDCSHIHTYEWNWKAGKPLKGNMPIAVPIDELLLNYQDALAYTEKLFRIKGVAGLPIPPWTSRLVP